MPLSKEALAALDFIARKEAEAENDDYDREYLRSSGFNSVVLELLDDRGMIAYKKSNDPLYSKNATVFKLTGLGRDYLHSRKKAVRLRKIASDVAKMTAGALLAALLWEWLR